MNIRIILLMVCLPSALQIAAQSPMPSVHELEFEVVADRYNTYNSKREPMTFLSGFTLEGDIQSLIKNPVEVLFNPVVNVDRSDCILMRWDPVMRVWNKLAGNQLKSVQEGSNTYWAARIDSPGHFAMMKELPKSGRTQLVLPDGCTADEWRYVQRNVGVVCEGFTQAGTLAVPLVSLSPVGQVSIRYRKTGQPVQQVSEVLLGTLVSDFWKEPDAVNPTYEMSFASVK